MSPDPSLNAAWGSQTVKSTKAKTQADGTARSADIAKFPTPRLSVPHLD